MSVRYSTRIGYGFYIPYEEIREVFGEDENLYNEFQENDYAMAIDAYNPDTSDYFFGIEYITLDPGDICNIPVYHNFLTSGVVSDMIDEFKKFFPNHKDMMCHDWVLSCID